jgi:uncharacterized protein YkuJ
LKNEPETYDESILSEEQKQFLNQKINMNEYLERNEVFCEKVAIFSKKREWILRQLKNAQNFAFDEINDRLRESFSLLGGQDSSSKRCTDLFI